jgi:hypothetical protein
VDQRAAKATAKLVPRQADVEKKKDQKAKRAAKRAAKDRAGMPEAS